MWEVLRWPISGVLFNEPVTTVEYKKNGSYILVDFVKMLHVRKINTKYLYSEVSSSTLSTLSVVIEIINHLEVEENNSVSVKRLKYWRNCGPMFGGKPTPYTITIYVSQLVNHPFAIPATTTTSESIYYG